MLSALISSAGRKPAMLLAEQLAHESCVRPGPLVLGTALLKSLTPTEDRDRHSCYPSAPVGALRARSFLPGSACRHAGRTISSPPLPAVFGIWSLRILDASVPCTRRYRPPPFMESASLTSAAKPSAPRCSPLFIALTIWANVRNSRCFELRRGCVSKNGMTFVSRSSLRRTTNTSEVSALARWFSRIRPQPNRRRMRSRTSRRSAFWLTWNSGMSCQPVLVPSFRQIATWNEPSPSTKPAIYASSLSC